MNNIKSIFLIYLCMIVLLSISVYAQSQNFSLSNGYKWLNKTVTENSWSGDVDQIAISILALGSGGLNTLDGIKKLENLQAIDGSWNGNIYDTSWATYALFKSKRDVSKSINWLLDKQAKAATTGNWLIQVKTVNSGSCKITINDAEYTFDVDSNGVSCDLDGIKTWVDLENCGSFNIGINETVNINCNNLGNADISMIYKYANNYYILDSKISAKFATFDIENAYFGNYHDTAYATWALYEIGKESRVFTVPYLRTNIRKDNNVDRALMLLITNNDAYSSYLEESQNNFTGSWDERNVFNTAFVIFALKKNARSSKSIASGVEWLENEQNVRETSLRYGSWNNGDIRDTAMTLYALGSGFQSQKPLCENSLVESGEECDAEYDSQGNLIKGDDSKCLLNEICGSNCRCKSSVETECNTVDDCPMANAYDCISNKCELKQGYCFDDDDCDIDKVCSGENKCILSEPECTADEECGLGNECVSGSCEQIPGYCDDNNDCETGKCDKKINRCKEGNGFPIWIFAIVVIVIIGLVIFVFVKKGGIRLKRSKVAREKLQPIISRQQELTRQPNQRMERPRNYTDERLEEDIDKSIKRAKDLIGKK